MSACIYSYRNLATEHETLMQKYLHLLQIVETEKTVAKQLRQQIEDGEIEIERLKLEVSWLVVAPCECLASWSKTEEGEKREAEKRLETKTEHWAQRSQPWSFVSWWQSRREVGALETPLLALPNVTASNVAGFKVLMGSFISIGCFQYAWMGRHWRRQPATKHDNAASLLWWMNCLPVMDCEVFQASFEQRMFFIICSVNRFIWNKKKYDCEMGHTFMCCFTIYAFRFLVNSAVMTYEKRNFMHRASCTLRLVFKWKVSII